MGKETRLKKRMNRQWFLFLASTLASLVNLFLPLVLVRILSPSEMGEYKIFYLYIQSIPMLFFASGILSGIPYWSGRKENGQIYLQQAFSLLLLIIFLFLILGLLGFYPVKLIGITTTNYFIFIFSSMLWMVSPFFEEVLIAEGSIAKASSLILFSESLKALVMILAAIKTHDITMVFWGFFIFLMFKILLGSYLTKHLHILKLTWIESIKTQVLKYSLPLSTATFFSVFIEKSDQIILTFFITAGEFADYSLACLTIPPLFMLEQSVTRVLLPKLTRHTHEPQKIIHDYKNAITHLALLIVPAVIGMITFSRPIILILFGEGYQSGHWYLKIYALSYLFLIFPHDLVHRAFGKSQWIMKTFFIISPIGLFLTLSLTFLFKAWGALTALLITKIIFKLIYLNDIKIILNTRINHLIPTKTIAYFFIIASILMTLSLATKSFFSSELKWFIMMGSTFFVSYLLSTKKYLQRFKEN